jgi:hypothetical protein
MLHLSCTGKVNSTRIVVVVILTRCRSITIRPRTATTPPITIRTYNPLLQPPPAYYNNIIATTLHYPIIILIPHLSMCAITITITTVYIFPLIIFQLLHLLQLLPIIIRIIHSSNRNRNRNSTRILDISNKRNHRSIAHMYTTHKQPIVTNSLLNFLSRLRLLLQLVIIISRRVGQDACRIPMLSIYFPLTEVAVAQ